MKNRKNDKKSNGNTVFETKPRITVDVDKVGFFQLFDIYKGVKIPWLLLVIGLIIYITVAVLNLNVATFSGDMIDASGAVPTDQLVKYIVSAVVICILTGVYMMLTGIAYSKIILGVRTKLWDKVMKIKQKTYDADGGESLVSRVVQDCEYACKYFEITLSIIATLVSTVIYVVGMYKLSAKLSNYVLIFIPVSILLGWGYSVLKFIMAAKYQGLIAKSTAYLVERTKDLTLIKTCNAQNREIAEGQRYFVEQYDVQFKIGMVQNLSTMINELLNLISIIIPFVVGAALFSAGEVTLGAIVSLSGLFGNVKTSFNNLITNVGLYKEANGALARVKKVLEYEEEALDEGESLGGAVSDIEFNNVDFRYTADKNILNQLSFHIPKNKVTAIVGTNGSGKTTTIKLIDRLYEPNDGVIYYGGVDARKYSLKSWRDKFCLIAQGSPMMAGTIRENICYGKENVSEERLMEVAKLSHVWDFVKDLPDGFDSYVAPGGNNFSGGQKQCIAIARAMMSDKEYLVLDEATSNLDIRREHDVLAAVNTFAKDRTTVIIAHSLAAVKNADHVIVIKNGVLESEGEPSIILNQTDNYLAKMMNRANV